MLHFVGLYAAVYAASPSFPGQRPKRRLGLPPFFTLHLTLTPQQKHYLHLQRCHDTNDKSEEMLGMLLIVKLVHEGRIKGANIAINLLVGSLAHCPSHPPSPLSFPPIQRNQCPALTRSSPFSFGTLSQGTLPRSRTAGRPLSLLRPATRPKRRAVCCSSMRTHWAPPLLMEPALPQLIVAFKRQGMRSRP